MLDENIDPPCDEFREDTLDWLDDLQQEIEEDEAAALHSFECRTYNEKDRRSA